MARTNKATEEPAEATVQSSVGEMTLEQLQARVAELEAEKVSREKKIDQLEGQEEGWLVWVDNLQYDGVIYEIQFSSGQAWIPKDRIIPRFVRHMPSDSELQKEANDMHNFDHKTTLEDVRSRYAETCKMSSAEFVVKILTNDHGYHARYFSRSDLEDLKKFRNDRARQRAEADARLGSMKDQAERLEKEHMRVGA